MTLIIEDGSIVSGAESYATALELVDYAAKFGRTMPATESEQESLLRRAALLMESYNWAGIVVLDTQPLAWPRYDVVYRGFLLVHTEIPAKIKAGQMALACDIYDEDIDDPETKVGPLVRRKLDVLEQEFADRPVVDRKKLERKQSMSAFSGGFLASSSAMAVARN